MIDSLVEQLALWAMKDYSLSMTEALQLVFNSQLYDKVVDLDTGLYYQSAAYNYGLLKHELVYGKLG
ncbi:MAG: hypothetical protein UCJ13_10390 [Bacteroidaceae bacterium]|nr:hypothetical protein [Bacteroidaceae bacterium]MEE0691236.1 hypothetical protein [Bacteroidaceae bacterium]MEE1147366.1 hypothetical protein [Bacteroidaceae bacterium]MEE1235373.1 hypothetical protein [Bacteroidaceae bacterium]